MITECYIKGRFDYGVGKCAVVITEDVPKGEEKKVLHQVAWRVPELWQYEGETVAADQFNCEILAACYALKWCMENKKPLVNIYSNLTTAEKWYVREDFPEARATMGKAYCKALEDYYGYMDAHEGHPVIDRIYAEYIPKSCGDMRYMEYNDLVNRICEELK